MVSRQPGTSPFFTTHLMSRIHAHSTLSRVSAAGVIPLSAASSMLFEEDAVSSMTFATALVMASDPFIAHVPGDPCPASAARTGLMAHRLHNNEERLSVARQLLSGAAAAPRTDIVPHFSVV